MKAYYLTLAGFLVILGGCCVGPRYCPPHCQVVSAWVSPLTPNIVEEGEIIEWWGLFQDPVLDAYIKILHRDNLDVKIAFEKVCEARMRLFEANAGRFPSVYLEVGEEHSVPGGFGSSGGGGSIGGKSPFDVEQTRRRGLLNAMWEVDLFGRLARKRDSAKAWEIMACYDAYGVLISLIGDFVGSYVQVRGIQGQLTALGEERKALQEKAAMTEWRVRQGIDDAVSHDLVIKEINALKSAGEALAEEWRVRTYHLAVLLGRNPGDLLQELANGGELPKIPDQVAVGLPSTLLRRRPDIHWAEWQFAKATADEGFAVADCFPQLTLTGSVGYEFLKLGSLAWDGVAWSYGGKLLATIFDAGASQARVKQQSSLRRQASLSYGKTVLSAMEEAETALAHFYAAVEKEKAADASHRAQARIASHTASKANRGLVNGIQEIDQRRLLLQEKRILLEKKTDSLVQVVALYKALGGGWKPS